MHQQRQRGLSQHTGFLCEPGRVLIGPRNSRRTQTPEFRLTCTETLLEFSCCDATLVNILMRFQQRNTMEGMGLEKGVVVCVIERADRQSMPAEGEGGAGVAESGSYINRIQTHRRVYKYVSPRVFQTSIKVCCRMFTATINVLGDAELRNSASPSDSQW